MATKDHSTSPSEQDDYETDDRSELGSEASDARAQKGDIANNAAIRVAESKTQQVERCKSIFFIVLATIGVVVAGVVYLLLDSSVNEAYETAIDENSNDIVAIVYVNSQNLLKSLESFALMITTIAIETGTSWPMIEIPHYEMRGTQSNDLSGLLQTSFAPLVASEDRQQWEDFAFEHQDWISAGIEYSTGVVPQVVPNISTSIYYCPDDGDHTTKVVQTTQSNYAPVWQQAPAPQDPSAVNFDLLSDTVFNKAYKAMLQTRQPVISQVTDLDWLYGGAVGSDEVEHPHSVVLHPVFRDLSSNTNETSDIVGFAFGILQWDTFLSNTLMNSYAEGMTVVLHDTCGNKSYTYLFNGSQPFFLGQGDLHDPRFDHHESTSDISQVIAQGQLYASQVCPYDLLMYPTPALEGEYSSAKSIFSAIIVAFGFICIAAAFVAYDVKVRDRHNAIMTEAKQNISLVSSLFPKNIRERILQEKKNQDPEAKKSAAQASSHLLKALLDEGKMYENRPLDSKPIADLFPQVTVMFADIVGFTAWSSTREPPQVFTLLETLYAAFDEIAKKRGVFKVETVGDCYVAVTGLPDPRPDHAIVMARFATDCLHRMNILTKKLEVSLGPDTGDLAIRVGLHSGPVTAGVLRGEKSRFQLFGDTMNTTARVETTGSPNRIHISVDTAALLLEAGKAHWITEREDRVEAKGKGDMTTYWLTIGSSSGGSLSDPDPHDHAHAKFVDAEGLSTPSSHNDEVNAKEHHHMTKSLTKRNERLIDWIVDVILRLLRDIVARRMVLDSIDPNRHPANLDEILTRLETMTPKDGSTVLEEVQEVIVLPSPDDPYKRQNNPDTIALPDEVVAQVRDFVRAVASMYRDNAFHNFDHASHVTMSTVKLLSRIVTPECELEVSEGKPFKDKQFGITRDPLTRFSCVFASVIHDLDHPGVPNTQLVKEGVSMAHAYKGRSVAEQNSVDLAWNLLMDKQFKEFRRTIYTTVSGFTRFRQLTVNCVMATDIMDVDLKNIRNAKWDKAFDDSSLMESEHQSENRKATIVMEHLLQASDVSHTMQHWHVYTKWNERLFREMYKAYLDGRADTDPATFWYKGEIGFFDYYIIPLAKKLKTCGVFGVSSDEYLNYAMCNRREWEAKGQELVASYVERLRNER